MVDNEDMKILHKLYMKTEETTDVLSFPLEKVEYPDQIKRLGDIAICYPEARKIAIKKNRLMDDVLGELAEHGTYHLLGIHHE